MERVPKSEQEKSQKQQNQHNAHSTTNISIDPHITSNALESDDSADLYKWPSMGV